MATTTETNKPFIMDPAIKKLLDQMNKDNHKINEIENNGEYKYLRMAFGNYIDSTNCDFQMRQNWLEKEMLARGYKNQFIIGQQYGRIIITKRTKCFLFFDEICGNNKIARKLKLHMQPNGDESIDMCLCPNQTPIKLMAYDMAKTFK